MSFQSLVFQAAQAHGLMALLLVGVYGIARLIRNAGLVDVFWGYGFIVVVLWWCSHLSLAQFTTVQWVTLGLVLAASLRLGTYLLFRFLHEHPHEDPRYTAFREQWQAHPEWMTFGVFQFQGLLLVTISWPFLLIFNAPEPPVTGWSWAGTFLCLMAILGEGIADNQIKTFKANPDNRGRTCQTGLWHVSRHPNYFFQWLLWCGFALIAWPLPYGPMALVSPLLMYYFLTQVTGIAATEAQTLKSRSDYALYQQKTSAFFPWFPKDISS